MRAKCYLILLLFVFFSSSLFSQSSIISGKVLFIDEGVKGAAIELSDSGKKVYTDKKGEFSIEIVMLPAKIKVRYKRIGKEVFVDKQSFIIITLVPKEKKLFKLIKENPDLSKCNIFLKEYPNGKYSSQIMEIKEKLIFVEAYDFAVEYFAVEKLEEYILKYPDGIFLWKARNMIEITLWQLACRDNTIDGFNKYLKKYPNGIAAKLAKEKIAELNRK